MKTSIKISVDKSGLDKITKEIIKSSASKDVLNEIGDTLVRMNKKNSRTGKDGDGNNYKNLSRDWIDERTSLSKKTPTHISYGKNRSNATFTGQLIDSIYYFIDEKSKSITLDFKNIKRSRYINEKGKAVGNIDTKNSDIAKSFNDRGSKILGFNEEMKKRIEFILTSSIRKLLKFK